MRAHVYQAGPDQVDSGLWNHVVGRVYMVGARTRRSPTLLVLTLTAARLGELNRAHASGLSLDKQLGGVRHRHGHDGSLLRRQAQGLAPGGSQDTIEAILDQTRAQINARVAKAAPSSAGTTWPRSSGRSTGMPSLRRRSG